MKHICALTFLIVFISASASFAAGTDPLKVHEGGFGPEIQGLQLGKPMTWLEMIDRQRNINAKFDAPGLLIFGVIIADTYKAANHEWKWRNEGYPTDLPGKWLLVHFGYSEQAELSNSGGGIMSKVPKNGTLNDLFVFLKKNSMNYASTENIRLHDERVVQYSMKKKAFPTEAATAGDFAAWLSKTYSLGTMEQKGKEYEGRNLSEGWRVVVTDNKVTIFSVSISNSSNK